VETVLGDGGVFFVKGGIGLRGPVSADDAISLGRGQVLPEAVEEVDEPDVHLLRLSGQGIPEDMIDPAELARKIIPRLPKYGFELFSRMRIEQRDVSRGVGPGQLVESRASGRRHGPDQDGESSQLQEMAAARQISLPDDDPI
jgi:hypothetical protein